MAHPSQPRRAHMKGAWVSAVFLSCWIPLADCLAGQKAEAMSLLEGIGESARELTYDGVFIYRQGNDIETVRIIHRADERGERERLISLSGAPREVVRTDLHVTCVNSSRRSVFVEALPLQSPWSGVSNLARRDIGDHYHFSVGPGERVAGRKTTRLVISPRDAYRYGYALWIDHESGLLLRSDLMGKDGEVLEQMLYTQIRLADHIPDHLLDSPLLTDGYTVHEPVGDGAAKPGVRREPQWRIRWVPDGFRSHQVIATEQPEGWSEHHLYSDGIATFSVYVEPLVQGNEPYEGLSTMGALSAFGRVAGANQLVVVGEVPSATVTRVGDSVSAP